MKYEDEKQALLADRLETLIDCAKQLDDRVELNRYAVWDVSRNMWDITTTFYSQLSNIQGYFEESIKRKSRLGIMQVQRKLALWEELDSKVNRVMEMSMVRIIYYTVIL